MSDINLRVSSASGVNLRVGDNILEIALEAVFRSDTPPAEVSVEPVIVVTDDVTAISLSTVLIVGESDMAAARAVNLIRAGRLGSACSRDEIQLVPSLVHALRAGCVAAPLALSSRARRAPALSDDLYEVLTLILKGRTNPEIAMHMKCSVATVKRRVGELLILLGATNRIDLVRASAQ